MRPVIDQIDAFDAKSGATIKFYYGGEVSYGSKINVYRSNDLKNVIYTNSVVNMKCQNSIEADKLKNGFQYAVEVVSYSDANLTINKASEISNKVYFWCFSNPQFEFNDLSDGDIINSQSIELRLIYEQADGIEISQCKYELYNSSMTVIDQSIYWSNYDENNTFTFNGLENNEIYYVRAYGSTTRGQILDTGYVSIFTQFDNPDSYSVIYADADAGNGVIQYNTNIKLIEPTRDNNTYKYDFGYINLEEDIITYNENILVSGDFIMAIRHKYVEGEFFKFSNSIRGFTISTVMCSDGKFRYKLMVPNEISNYILYSPPVVMNDDRSMTVWVKRVGSLYELTVFSEKDSSDEYNLFLGEIKPLSDITRYDVWINTDQNPTVRISKEDVVIWNQIDEPTDVSENDIWIDSYEDKTKLGEDEET